tara:strand:- start:2601 stop:3038 length:438 start_codon:yes stop_codon:yes gene_type:complete
MKKSEFKKIIKPIVSECIKESLLEDGLISGIISEVVRGMNTQPASSRAPDPEDPSFERMRRNAFATEKKEKIQEQRTKLMNAIGKDSYNGVNLFEGTTPAPAAASPTQQAGALSGQPSDDPGVDISNLFGSVNAHWNAHMSEVKK